MMGGRGSLGITESVENCGTVGVTEVVGSSVGSIELDEDSGTVMSAGSLWRSMGVRAAGTPAP